MSLLGAAILGYVGYKIFVEDKSNNCVTEQRTSNQLSETEIKQTIKSKVEYSPKFQGPIYSSVAGVTFNGRQYYVSKCYTGQQLRLVRDRFNSHDKNAIGVYAGANQIGFIKKELAATLAPIIDAGKELEAVVERVTGGGGYNYGVNIKITERV